MSKVKLQQNFKAEQQYWNFLGLGILTGGFYFMYWIARSLEVVSKDYITVEDTHVGIIKKIYTLLWTFCAIFFLALPLISDFMFDSLIEMSFASAGIYAVLSKIGLIAALIVYYMIIFALRKVFQYVFEQENINTKIETMWLLLFSVVYLYYTINSEVMHGNTKNTDETTTEL